jgi:twitching motility protein PilT
MIFTLDEMLEEVIHSGGSDLHLTTGTPPHIRVDGKLRPLGTVPLTPADTERLAYSIMTDAQKHIFEEKWELDFSFCVRELSRFRVDVFRQRGSVACAFRAIPFDIKSFEALGLPPAAERLCDKPRGLILVTGPTGSGKSTTLAAMIDKINRERSAHILTIEDPIEFVHSHKNCIVNQREVNSDTPSFPAALRVALREDPDVVLIGEMRDPETVESALRIAETGHLTLATLHTNTAASTMNRIVDMFPAAQQTHVRTQLSMVLEAIICQALIPRANGSGRSLAMEILIANPAIRNLIRENKTHQIYGMMQTGQEKYGMLTFNQSLAHLARTKEIALKDALSRSSSPEELKELIQLGAGMHVLDGPSRPGPPEPMPDFTW